MGMVVTGKELDDKEAADQKAAGGKKSKTYKVKKKKRV
jgi:hypothetical protein